MSEKPSINEQSVLEGKIFAVLSYLFILSVIPLLFKKDNEFVKYHGRQGIVLFVGEVAVFVASVLMSWIVKPAILIFGLYSLAGIIGALKGELTRLPLVTSIAEKITL